MEEIHNESNSRASQSNHRLPNFLRHGIRELNKRRVADTDNIRDFEEKEKAARDWGKKTNKKWVKNLLQIERQAFLSYTNTAVHINKLLRQFKGIPKKKADVENEAKNIILIFAMDNGLKKAKTNESMYVYRRVDELHFFSEEERSKHMLRPESPIVINRDVVDKIKQNFIDTEKEYKDPAFVSTSLSQDPMGVYARFGASRPILLKILLPKGSNAAYMRKEISQYGFRDYKSQSEILIARDQTFKYKDISIFVNKHGHESVLVTLEMLKK